MKRCGPKSMPCRVLCQNENSEIAAEIAVGFILKPRIIGPRSGCQSRRAGQYGAAMIII
jgi:hypothetical protein